MALGGLVRRCAIAGGMMLLAWMTPALAQDEGFSQDREPTESAPQERHHVCVQVVGDGNRADYLNCLNQELASVAELEVNNRALLQVVVNNSLPGAPSQVGVFDESATKESLGSAFGHSAIPARPTTPPPQLTLH